MSIEVIAWAWKCQLRPLEKYLLLAIADHANDETFLAWPSLSHLTKKTGLARTSVWRIVDRLIQLGLLERVAADRASTTYRVLIDGCSVHPGAACTQVQPAPEVGAGGNKVGAPCTPNHKEPSLTINSLSLWRDPAVDVLRHLIAKTGRQYRAVDTNLKPIMLRLRSGVTPEQCKAVVEKKWRDWHKDPKMEPYLRPKTLFAAANFENYLAECHQEKPVAKPAFTCETCGGPNQTIYAGRRLCLKCYDRAAHPELFT